jgi:bifunctional non-homologous end joining protein LigD
MAGAAGIKKRRKTGTTDSIVGQAAQRKSALHLAYEKRKATELQSNGMFLVQRKALLKSILSKDNRGRVRFTDHISGSGERLFAKLEALQLEGMVMKRKDSVYAFMRSRDWLKVRISAGRVTIQKRIENWS